METSFDFQSIGHWGFGIRFRFLGPWTVIWTGSSELQEFNDS